MQAVLVVGNDPEAVLTHVVADIEDQRSFVQVCMLKELFTNSGMISDTDDTQYCASMSLHVHRGYLKSATSVSVEGLGLRCDAMSEYGPKMMREVIRGCADKLDTYATVVVVALALVVGAVVAVVA